MLNSLVHIFKLTCIGTIHFKRNGKDFNERISENFLRSSNPSDIKNFTVATLIPNTFYSCHLQTVSGSRSSLPYSEIQFATPPGRPSPPPKPKIINYKDKFVVQLYKSNVKYGSISGYEVYAVPVFHSSNTSPSAGMTPKVSYNQLVSKAISPHLASSASQPLPFVLGKYEWDQLPEKLNFDGSLHKFAFKEKTYYRFVVAAFNHYTKGVGEAIYVLGEPSEPVLIGENLDKQWVDTKKDNFLHYALTAICTMIIVIIVFSLIISIAAVLLYINKKKYDKDQLGDMESRVSIKESVQYKRKVKSITKEPHFSSQKMSKYTILPIDEGEEIHPSRVTTIKRLSIQEKEEHEMKPDMYTMLGSVDSHHPPSPLMRSHRSSDTPLPSKLNRQSLNQPKIIDEFGAVNNLALKSTVYRKDSVLPPLPPSVPPPPSSTLPPSTTIPSSSTAIHTPLHSLPPSPPSSTPPPQTAITIPESMLLNQGESPQPDATTAASSSNYDPHVYENITISRKDKNNGEGRRQSMSVRKTYTINKNKSEQTKVSPTSVDSRETSIIMEEPSSSQKNYVITHGEEGLIPSTSAIRKKDTSPHNEEVIYSTIKKKSSREDDMMLMSFTPQLHPTESSMQQSSKENDDNQGTIFFDTTQDENNSQTNKQDS
jgi:hypothetical protein